MMVTGNWDWVTVPFFLSFSAQNSKLNCPHHSLEDCEVLRESSQLLDQVLDSAPQVETGPDIVMTWYILQTWPDHSIIYLKQMVFVSFSDRSGPRETTSETNEDQFSPR